MPDPLTKEKGQTALHTCEMERTFDPPKVPHELESKPLWVHASGLASGTEQTTSTLPACLRGSAFQSRGSHFAHVMAVWETIQILLLPCRSAPTKSSGTGTTASTPIRPTSGCVGSWRMSCIPQRPQLGAVDDVPSTRSLQKNICYVSRSIDHEVMARVQGLNIPASPRSQLTHSFIERL